MADASSPEKTDISSIEQLEELLEGETAPEAPSSLPGVTTRYVLIILQGEDEHGINYINQMLVTRVRKLMEKIDTLPENTIIDLWLDSPGGDAHAAYKLMLELRARCSRLRIIVPDYAKSAATLMVLGADEVFMGPSAELGPLDAQMEHPDREGERISALDITRALEYLGHTATSLVVRSGGLFVKFTALRRLEVLQATLDFAATFIEPITCKLDPSLIHRAQSELKVAQEYGLRLIRSRRILEEDQDRIDEDQLRKLPQNLVRDYPSHGFVIDIQEARNLGLQVKDGREYELWSHAERLHGEFSVSGKTLIYLLSEGELTEDRGECSG